MRLIVAARKRHSAAVLAHGCVLELNRTVLTAFPNRANMIGVRGYRAMFFVAATFVASAEVAEGTGKLLLLSLIHI